MASTPLTARYETAWFMEIACFCAVNCYALVSGYLCVNKKTKYSNLAYLWLQTAFYSIVITVVFLAVGRGYVHVSDLVKAPFPVMAKLYWYFTAYFLLFLFMPMLNHVLKTMSKRSLKVIILSSILTFSIMSLPGRLLGKDTFVIADGYSALWLVVLYLIGGYYKKYRPFSKISKTKAFAFFAACILVTWISKIVIDLATLKILGSMRFGDLFVSYASPTILAASFALFMMFENLQIRRMKKFVSTISQLSFSVYLIHTHPLIFRTVIAGRFANYSAFPAAFMALAVIGTSLSIYAICTSADYIRMQLFKLLRIKQRFAAIEERIRSKLLNLSILS